MKRSELKRGKGLAPSTYEEALAAQQRAAKKRVERAAAQRVPPSKGRGREPVPHKRKKPPSPAFRRTPPIPELARCMQCGNPAVHHHHVIYRQKLRWEKGDAADLRNLIPLCFPCHSAQHSQKDPVQLAALPDRVFEFAAELLGVKAYDYLARRYSGEDPRLEALLQEES